MVYQVDYWDPTSQRWLRAVRYPNREQADEKANELRVAGYDARVVEVKD